MTTSMPPLHDTIPRKSTILQRTFDLIILILLLFFLHHRLSSLQPLHHFLQLRFLAFLCESWFTFVWLLTMNCKWSPIVNISHPNHLLLRFQQQQQLLPEVDVFVTTADPLLEPPVITINTVLSLLAVDYPANRLACYVSDDAGSPATYYALVESIKFAKMWVPFCKKYSVPVRAPFVYFSNAQPHSVSSPSLSQQTTLDFMRDWKEMKREYEELCTRIQEGIETNAALGDDIVEYFANFQRGNHPSLVKILWENKDDNGEMGLPHIIYVAREKRTKHPHHYKAGAMNVLTRVSGVMSNAPFMLNVDCDMFVNDPKVILHAMCFLLGFDGNEVMSGFVQFPQHFYGGLKDDPFGNQLVALHYFLGSGIAGLQGPFYGGTGCFHRRKVIYGSTPPCQQDRKGDKEPQLSFEELKRRFGSSTELMESANRIMSGAVVKGTSMVGSLHSCVDAATHVAGCTYELNTCWGQKVGWIYGSMTEDVLTGLRIQSSGWRSAYVDLDPPAFLGSAPMTGPESLIQYKRWTTGMFEILLGPHSPFVALLTMKLHFRQCWAYVYTSSWALRSIPELFYSLLSPYCLLTNSSFLPKASDPAIIIPTSIFFFYNLFTLWEYWHCGLTFRAWWNNQKMRRIMTITAWLFGLIDVLSKTFGLSDTVFEVTRKDQNVPEDNVDFEPGRFTFDSSPLFVPATAVLLVNMVALGMAPIKAWKRRDDVGPGLGEVVCCVWVVLSLWPLVRGLIGRGRYGLPWSTICKGAAFMFIFLQLCL